MFDLDIRPKPAGKGTTTADSHAKARARCGRQTEQSMLSVLVALLYTAPGLSVNHVISYAGTYPLIAWSSALLTLALLAPCFLTNAR